MITFIVYIILGNTFVCMCVCQIFKQKIPPKTKIFSSWIYLRRRETVFIKKNSERTPPHFPVNIYSRHVPGIYAYVYKELGNPLKRKKFSHQFPFPTKRLEKNVIFGHEADTEIFLVFILVHSFVIMCTCITVVRDISKCFSLS